MPSSETEEMQCMEVWGGNEPVDNRVAPAGLDMWVYSKPNAGAAMKNDVHFVSSCATGRVTRLLVADVGGQREDVSVTTKNLRGLMRQNVNYLDQSRFVKSLNREFVSLTEQGRFATAIVATFFAPTNDLSLCNAGHPPPLIYWTKKQKWSILEEQTPGKPQNIPDKVQSLTSYQNFGVRLKVGDLVLCYTDALIESYGEDGELLGTKGLLKIVEQLDVSDPVDFVPALLRTIGTLSDENQQGDDLTVVLFRPNGEAAVPFKNKLAAPFRVLAGVIRALRPGGGPLPLPELSLPNIGGAMCSPLNRTWSRRNGTEQTQPESPSEG